MSGAVLLEVPPDESVVVFDYPLWAARYPEFSAVSMAQAQRYFDEACIFCQNDGFSPVQNLNQRRVYLDMLTAHIAALNGGLTACGSVAPGGGVGIVGRITSATEGSVSISADYGQGGGDGPSSAWYQQTPYGAMYWAATAQYRMFRVYLGPQPFYEHPYRPWVAGWRR